jgi:4-oxalocrotonate tautomerase family enzyme
MPIVRIELLEGRSSSTKAELMARVTQAVVTALGVEAEQVRVVLYEIPLEHWAVGGKTKAEFLEQNTKEDL